MQCLLLAEAAVFEIYKHITKGKGGGSDQWSIHAHADKAVP